MELKRLIVIFFCFTFGFLSIDARLVDWYKKGIIRLTADPQFGKGTDWEELFYDQFKSMAIAPDGSIFVINVRQNNFYKFSPDATKVLGKYSQFGEGPGDLDSPNSPSILDNKYLVIADYAVRRKISLFDFNGKIAKVIKTNHSVSSAVSLKMDRIAYMFTQFDASKKLRKMIIYIRNIVTGKETLVDTISIPQLEVKVDGITQLGLYNGSVCIGKTKNGNLLVGNSSSPEIKIYSPEGLLIRSFTLNYKPVQVTSDYIDRYKKNSIEDLKIQYQTDKDLCLRAIKRAKKTSYELLFGNTLPYYDQIGIDSDGNILVFKKTDCVGEKCPKIFQVYSPEGQFICETKIDEGNFTFMVNIFYKSIKFTEKGIIGLFSIKDSEDVSLRLVKVNIR